MQSSYRKLGEYIELVSCLNADLNYGEGDVRGVSNNKEIIQTKANNKGRDFSKFYVVAPNEFIYNSRTSRMGEKVGLGYNDTEKTFTTSFNNTVFRVKNDALLPMFLFMWFKRPEFDRYARYHSWGSSTEIFSWHDMCETELPIPSIEKQREIVKEYNTIVSRIKLNEQLNQKLEETAQALYKHWFIDLEFPDANGKPYKSSGGKMVFNTELDKEIPKGWEANSFTKVLNFGGGGTPSTIVEEYWNGDVPFYTPGDLDKQYYCIETSKSISELGLSKCSSKLYPRNTVFLTARGATVGGVALSGKPMAMNQTCYAIWGEDNSRYFAHQLSLWIIYRLKTEAIGATFEALVTKDFDASFVINPPNSLKVDFDKKVSALYEITLSKSIQNAKLTDFKNLLLSKMTKVETS